MDPESYLEGKICTIHGLVKALHLKGQSCAIIKWVEEKSRMNVELNAGSQVCVKLDNFRMEGELEPLLWSSKTPDKMGKASKTHCNWRFQKDSYTMSILKNCLVLYLLLNRRL